LAPSPRCLRGCVAISLLAAMAALTGCQGVAPAGGSEQPPHGTLSASPASLPFGNVTVGQSKTLTATLKASRATVNVVSATSTSAEFTISGASLPATLDAGQSLSFSITFTPQVSGAASATLHLASDADNSPTALSADGIATPAPQHSVGLSWNASQSPGVVGYNVYRKSTDHYSRINSSLEANTTFEDQLVDAGATYYYVVTAVDGNGTESDHSESIKVVIPTA
jgi:hypothetical protein